MAYVLAHLSDPHLAPLPEPRASELLGKRITGFMNWRRSRRFVHRREVLDALVADLKTQKPDHIAVSGDIANIALPQEFANGRAWLESLGSPHDVSLVPGNHDIYVPGAADLAARAWGPFMSDDDGGSRFPYLRKRGPMALIGLSSGVPTPWGMASGRLGPSQLAALADMLAALKHEQLFRVVTIHHPPVSQTRWPKLLRDAGALMRVIAAEGAELLIHGHDHLHMLNWLEGPGGTRVPAVGVPSASAAPGKAKNAAGYNLYAIGGEPGRWRCAATSRGIGLDGTVKELRRMTLTN